MKPNWQTKKLKDLVEIKGGYAFKSNDFTKSGYPLIKIGDINEHSITHKNISNFLPKSFADSKVAYLAKKGDILIALSGATTGKYASYSDDKPALVNQRVGLVKPTEKVDTKYIYYFIASITKDILDEAYGAAQPNISTNEIGNFEIPEITLLQQKKLSQTLDSLFSKLDSAEADLEKVEKMLEVYRKALMNSLFDDILKYKRVKITDVAEITNGFAFKSSNMVPNGDFQVVKMGNISQGSFRIDNRPAFIDTPDKSIIDKYEIKKNEIVITLTGTKNKRDYGYVAINEEFENLLLNQRIAKLKFDETTIHIPYAYFYLQSEAFRDKFFSYETGNVGQGNVSIRAISEEYIYLPEMAIQRYISDEIEKSESIIRNVKSSITSLRSLSKSLRQAILKKAFEGGLI